MLEFVKFRAERELMRNSQLYHLLRRIQGLPKGYGQLGLCHEHPPFIVFPVSMNEEIIAPPDKTTKSFDCPTAPDST